MQYAPPPVTRHVSGVGLTVTVKNDWQPPNDVNVIVATPAERPLTTPVHESTGATVVLLLRHPQVPLHPVSVIEEPTQTVWEPLIVHAGLMVIVAEPGILVVQPD